MVPTCITGRVVALPAGRPLQSGATHLLQNASGQTSVFLRAGSAILAPLEGRTVRLCGRYRGKVGGEPFRLFEVESGILLDAIPLRPGLDPYTGPASVSANGLPVRPLVGL